MVWRPSGTVSNTASATKASVPSEPTTSRRKISSGVSASRNAHRRYPVVFLIWNLRAMRSASSRSERMRSRIRARPAASSGAAAANCSSASACAVSITAPLARTSVIALTVR